MILFLRLCKSKILKLSIIYFIAFLSFDFIFGNSIIKLLYKNNFLSNQKIKLEENFKEEKKYRIKHNYFHHTLKENIEAKSYWGPYVYKTCTDRNGFRKMCNKTKIVSKKKNIVLIGDSFTEGIGLNYEKTFAGMLSNSSKNNIINMGVISYSPIIYKNKIQFYLDKGFKIDHLFVFIDISDIDDETIYYSCDNNSVCSEKDDLSSNNNQITQKINFPIFKNIKRSIRLIKRNFFPKIHVYEKNFERSSWTYIENNSKIQKGIDSSIKNMDELYHLLKQKNIPISIAVYPWPGQILYDVKNSKQVEIWKKFCVKRCDNFINLFPIFFEEITNNKRKKVVEKFYLKNDIHFNEIGNRKIFSHINNLKLF